MATTDLTAINPQLQHALDTVLSMVQTSALSGMNPLASSIQAAIDTKVEAALNAQLQGTMMASRAMMSQKTAAVSLTSVASGLPPPSSLRSPSASTASVAKPEDREPVFVTPEVQYPNKPMAMEMKASGLVKIGEGKYATISKLMRQTKKEEKDRRRSQSLKSETGSSSDEKGTKNEEKDAVLGTAVWAELAKLGPTKVNNHTALTTSFQAF
jgi:hypothetical protein